MLTRYRRPQASLSQISRDPFFNFIDRFFNDVNGGMERFNGDAAEGWQRQSWIPAMDVVENQDAFIATADLPGLTKEDIQISLDEGTLTISGERKLEHQEQAEDGKGFRRFERAYGAFNRSFSLPQGIDQENVTASFDNGVLTLSLPKSEIAKSRTISIS